MIPRAGVGGRAADLEKKMRDAFRGAGWKVDRGDDADLVVHGFNRTYVIRMKAAAEGRADRLIPLLAQAILEARVAAREQGGRAIPVAIVAVRRLPPRTLKQLSEFARVHAPDVAFGAIDAQGLRHFSGKGLQALNAQPRTPTSRGLMVGPKVGLFSDLNQWLIKVLLAPYLNDRKRLNAPRRFGSFASSGPKDFCDPIMRLSGWFASRSSCIDGGRLPFVRPPRSAPGGFCPEIHRCA